MGRAPQGERECRTPSLLRRIDAEIVPFDARHAAEASRAWERYGRGSGHPAGLNFGDCMVYAVASLADEPLLFKGDDFARTDLGSALA
ncbi:PIN domain-containing protein [Nocardioides caeni]|uniref:Type II toxin-antitoxin system VapC family toxin n=1 Tax=Nocardioides caeni TaxID=574700 RepID=A0A4S8NMW5_9ACTN|nr:type II toxin-antitoxin system VapC family toxin [Nocardioides caeni]THV17801.1 type II toxin-antitoxin system VapC family toxin [Nocardioides caeni]